MHVNSLLSLSIIVMLAGVQRGPIDADGLEPGPQWQLLGRQREQAVDPAQQQLHGPERAAAVRVHSPAAAISGIQEAQFQSGLE